MAFASVLPIAIGAPPPPPPKQIDYWDDNQGRTDQSGNPIFYGEGPTYATSVWDLVTLKGNKLPGICKVKAFPVLRFDKKKPGGADGLTITSQGYIPGPVEIEVVIWTQEQWQVFQQIASDIWSKPKRGDVIPAIDIKHPATDLWGIRSIVIEGVSVPEDGPIPQSKIIKIKAVEFVPPSAKTKTNTIKASNLPVDKNIQRNSKNAGGDPPSKTDTKPTGAAKDKTPGST